MKVLLAALDSPATLEGGVEWYVHRLGVALRERGHDVRIAARSPRAPRPDLERDVAYAYVKLPHLPGPPSHRHRMLFQGLFDRGVRRLAEGNDIVHGQNVDFAGAVGVAPVVSTVHTTPLDEWASSRLGGWRERLYQRPLEDLRVRHWKRNVPALALAWTPAAHVAESLRALGARRIELLPNPVPPLPRIPRDEARRALGLPADRPVVLFLGRLAQVKRPGRVLDALAGLPGYEGVFAGDGPEREALERRARELGLSDRVRFLGRVDDAQKAQLLNAADVFCLPSEHEGQPLAILEAMSLGTPVVATRAEWVPPGLAAYGRWGTDVARLLREAVEAGRGAPAPVPDYAALAREVERGYEQAVVGGASNNS